MSRLADLMLLTLLSAFVMSRAPAISEFPSKYVGMSDIRESVATYYGLRENVMFNALVGGRRRAVAVTNERRQIVMANELFVRMTQAGRVEELIGQTLGEALRCLPSNPENGEYEESRCSDCPIAHILNRIEEGAPCRADCILVAEESLRKYVVHGELLRRHEARFALVEFARGDPSE